MELEKIMSMWEEDAHIDDKDLDNESLNIPNVHQKYLDIYSKEKRKLSDLETHWKVLFQQRWEVVISKNGKAPDHNIRISKTELERHYVAADSVLQKAEYIMNEQKSKVDYLKSVLSMIENRSFHINIAGLG
jgi:tetrahydrodipicolinate N-succinyltransferase